MISLIIAKLPIFYLENTVSNLKNSARLLPEKQKSIRINKQGGSK
jgi:hypothetical protein